MGVFNNFPYANFHELNADWIIEQVRKVMDEWEEYKTDMDLWKLGVDDQLAAFQAWFDNLDVQDEVRTVMNELILSGEFIEITSPQIVSATEAWLAAHVTPTTPAVDNTLTISGAAADAKVTGDRISDLKEELNDVQRRTVSLISINDFTNVGYIRGSDGIFVSAPNNFTTNFIPVKAGDSFYIKSYVDNNRSQIAYYTNNDGSGYQQISAGDQTNKEYAYTVANDGYVRFSYSYPNFYKPIFYYTGELPYTITKYVDDNINVFESVVNEHGETLEGVVKFDENDFEIGNIAITSSGWSYSDSTSRVRLKEGQTMMLLPGDTVTVGEDVRLYVGWMRENGSYATYGSWITNNTFIMPEFGYCVFLATAVPEAVVLDINDIISKIVINKLDCIVNKIDNNSFIKSINHRGFNFVAPENTLPAYELSDKIGFEYVETDVRFTSDNIPVLLHDESINRTARNADGTTLENTINIDSITYAQAQTYDFGIYKSETYAGTKIPSFDDFIKLCKSKKLHPYIDIKGSVTQTQVNIIINILVKYGMLYNSTLMAFATSTIDLVLNTVTDVRIGFISPTIDNTVIGVINGYKTNNINIFLDVELAALTQSSVETLISNNIKVECYTPDSINTIRNLPLIIQGGTTNVANIGLIINKLYE